MRLKDTTEKHRDDPGERSDLCDQVAAVAQQEEQGSLQKWKVTNAGELGLKLDRSEMIPMTSYWS